MNLSRTVKASATPVVTAPKLIASAGKNVGAVRKTDHEIRILRTLAEIEEFRTVWKKWSDSPTADIDYFLRTETDGPLKSNSTPFIPVLLSGNVPVAMLIARLAEAPMDFRLVYKSLFRARLNTLSVAWGGFLGEESDATASALAGALVDALKKGEADVLHFNQLRIDRPFFKQLCAQVPFLFKDHSWESRRHWKLTFSPTRDNLFSEQSGFSRKKIRWRSNKFEKDFPGSQIMVRCFQSPDELEQMIPDVETVARQSYQRNLGASFVDCEATRKRLAFEARQGWLRMYVLYVNHQPVAYWWGTLYKRIFYSVFVGYDQAYRKYSPGTYLLLKVLEDQSQQDTLEVDHGFGEFEYKQRFGNACWNETTLFYVFAPRLRPVALNLARTLVGGSRLAVRRLLIGSGALPAVRKFRKNYAGKNGTPASPLAR